MTCISVEKGIDGARHHKGPIKFKIRLPAAMAASGEDLDTRSCENHIQDYLSKGWMVMARICTNCTIAEATVDDTCEACLDKLTAPSTSLESGYCKNRDQIWGCSTYAQGGTKYCAFCTKQGYTCPEDTPSDQRKLLPRSFKPRYRPIPSSVRPCNISVKKDCKGTMEASVALFSPAGEPEVWWHCKTCQTHERAHVTAAIPAKDVLSGPDGTPAAIWVPQNADLAEQVEQVKVTLGLSHTPAE